MRQRPATTPATGMPPFSAGTVRERAEEDDRPSSTRVPAGPASAAMLARDPESPPAVRRIRRSDLPRSAFHSRPAHGGAGAELERRVRERPLPFLLAGAAAGYLVGRFLR